MDEFLVKTSRKQSNMHYWKKRKAEDGSKKAGKRVKVEIDNTRFEKLPICGYEVKLPEGVKPYPTQKHMISRILTGLTKRQNVLAESPTGSGKTLALLASTCVWLTKYKEDREKAKQSCPVHGKTDEIVVKTLNETSVMDNSLFESSIYEDHELDSDFAVLPSGNKTGMEDSNDAPVPADCCCLPKVRIYYGTRTHKQISQVVKEFRRLPYGGVLKHTILASREQSCISDVVRASGDLTGTCKEMISDPDKGCIYKTAMKTSRMDEFTVLRRHIERNGSVVFDIEDLVDTLKSSKPNVCPYFCSTRVLTQDADIIFCPFSYLIDPVIRHSSDVIMKNSVIILDEAHNIEDSCRESASFTFFEKEISDAFGSCKAKGHEVDRELMKERDKLQTNNENTLIELLTEFNQALSVILRVLLRIRRWFENVCEPVLTCPVDNYTKQRNQTLYWSYIQESLEKFNLLTPEKSPEYEELMAAFRLIAAKDTKGDNKESMSSYKPSGVCIVLIEKWLFFQCFFSEQKFKSTYRLNVQIEELVASRSFSSNKNEMSMSQGPKNMLYDSKDVWQDSRQPNDFLPVAEGCKTSVSFWCMSSEITFIDAFNESHSVILASGTLCPPETLVTELGMDFKIQVEGNQVIAKDRIFASVVPVGPSGNPICVTYNKMQDGRTLPQIVSIIQDICNTVPKGILCFVPSYRVLKDIMDHMRNNSIDVAIGRKKVILEEPRRSSELANVMNSFEEAISNSSRFGATVDGALMLAVYRGKISEGIDFADDKARVVISLGIPYPNFTDHQVVEKRKYNDENSKSKNILTGEQWYTSQAYRALNQALGRCLRHKQDWGALVLIDDRLRSQAQPQSSNSMNRVSKWIREQLVVYNNYGVFKNNLKAFVERLEFESSADAVAT